MGSLEAASAARGANHPSLEESQHHNQADQVACLESQLGEQHQAVVLVLEQVHLCPQFQLEVQQQLQAVVVYLDLQHWHAQQRQEVACSGVHSKHLLVVVVSSALKHLVVVVVSSLSSTSML